METSSSPWKSVFLAPLASVPAAAIAGLGSSDAGLASDFFWGIFLGAILGVPIAYIGMLVIGMPAYWALEKVGLVRWWTLSATGALAAFPIFSNSAPFRTSMMAVAAGAAVGATAYFLLPRNQRHEGGNDA